MCGDRRLNRPRGRDGHEVHTRVFYTIVRNGECDFRMMRSNHVSKHDLEEDMRLHAHTDDLSKIRLANVERSGDISFIKK